MSAHTLAHELKAYVNGAVAWNVPSALATQVTKRTKNQHGTTYRFRDGSLAFVPKGQAYVIVQE